MSRATREQPQRRRSAAQRTQALPRRRNRRFPCPPSEPPPDGEPGQDRPAPPPSGGEPCPPPFAPCWPARFSGAGGYLPILHGVGGFATNAPSSSSGGEFEPGLTPGALHYATPRFALHRALRRMAGLVFRLLVFWVLAGACQRHGVGGFLVQLIFIPARLPDGRHDGRPDFRCWRSLANSPIQNGVGRFAHDDDELNINSPTPCQ